MRFYPNLHLNANFYVLSFFSKKSLENPKCRNTKHVTGINCWIMFTIRFAGTTRMCIILPLFVLMFLGVNFYLWKLHVTCSHAKLSLFRSGIFCWAAGALRVFLWSMFVTRNFSDFLVNNLFQNKNESRSNFARFFLHWSRSQYHFTYRRQKTHFRFLEHSLLLASHVT